MGFMDEFEQGGEGVGRGEELFDGVGLMANLMSESFTLGVVGWAD